MTDKDFAGLLSRAQPRLRALVAQSWPAKYDRLVTRQDVTQMVNVAAWTSRPGRPFSGEQFDEWLQGIVHSTLRDAWLRLERTTQAESPLSALTGTSAVEGLDPASVNPASMVAASELRERVRRAIASLSKSDQEILRLRFDGADFKTVARELQRQPATVRQAFHRALQFLRQRLNRRRQFPT